MTDTIVLVIELLGVAAFAVSGALTAVSQEMDLFGVLMLGTVTAVGGGVIRDLILGVTPPMTFRDPIYALVALGVSLVTFLPAVRRQFFKQKKVYDVTLLIMDTLGLAVFTVAGVQAAFYNGHANNIFLILFVGVVTGTGGGVLRDVMCAQRPYVFVKHFYATASLIGAGVCIALWHFVGQTAAIVGGAVVIVVLRFLAARFHWKLPRARNTDAQRKDQPQNEPKI